MVGGREGGSRSLCCPADILDVGGECCSKESCVPIPWHFCLRQALLPWVLRVGRGSICMTRREVGCAPQEQVGARKRKRQGVGALPDQPCRLLAEGGPGDGIHLGRGW